MYDCIIIGGGIIGLSTAYHLKKDNPELNILLLEKENKVAKHQTGHNSGVIHSGIYYKPGSYKAKFAKAGASSMIKFCKDNDIPYKQCGKLIVATDENQLGRLRKLYERGLDNKLDVSYLNYKETIAIEPHVNAVASVKVNSTGIVDYKKVSEKLLMLFENFNGTCELMEEVISIHEDFEKVTIKTNDKEYTTKYYINCAGLYSDKIAKIGGIKTDIQIIPFRGEYFELKKDKHSLVKTLIYPVPDPKFPFLGVHFTNMIDGGVDCGPNAVLGFSKESYGKFDIKRNEMIEILKFKGIYKLGLKHLKMGLGEYYRSFNKKAFVKNAQKLIPQVREEDFIPMEAGVRAQAMNSKGELIDDFYFESSKRSIHVLNAPSPAATASLEIGKEIVNKFKMNTV
ncbi:L-2-hydroxyglutarate oxidase [Macrococcoides bohemicum]|uniref:L-2-hydroxyglutarate oxidase n=1 Tax=Macrococcoides bohemicum TaxID=1903056 RepID=UPI00105A97BE|nr:L-2-hydroxyglutarate oxidase [Macrococcus bohemicus]QYA44252.1 L-2-hydroxyglutarate oxidase [Macrococcus bohemicus]TDL35595.1 L-2-hydroxyglutarate oxidase [Macrococcus bohemicus]